MCSTCGASDAGRLAVERAPLVDAEAVLLVDHGDGQAVELDRLLDQRVGADEQLQLPGGQLAEEVGAAPGRCRPGEQGGLHERARHQRLERREVLLGERLGGRHQRRLGARLDGPQHRVQRHDGLARAHLPHQQPLHRPVARDLLVDGVHRPPLVARGRERQRLAQPAGGQLARPGRARRRARPPAAARGAAGARSARAAARRRPAAAARPRGRRSARRRAPPGGRGACRATRMRAGSGSSASRAAPPPLAHEREDLGRGEAVGGRVGGHLRRLRPHGLAGLGVELHAEAVARLVLALEQQPGARPVLALEPRLVEERRLHRPRLVGHDGLDERAHAAPPDRAARDRADLDDDGRRLAGREVDQRAGAAAVARKVLEQVADREQPERARRAAAALGGETVSGAASRDGRG